MKSLMGMLVNRGQYPGEKFASNTAAGRFRQDSRRTSGLEYGHIYQ